VVSASQRELSRGGTIARRGAGVVAVRGDYHALWQSRLEVQRYEARGPKGLYYDDRKRFRVKVLFVIIALTGVEGI